MVIIADWPAGSLRTQYAVTFIMEACAALQNFSG
jgi:hypothetical protein